MTDHNTLLRAQNITMDFGGLRAVDAMTLEIKSAQITALIGPNGAGKTTVLNCLTGIYAPTHGEITVFPPTGASVRIEGMLPHRITQLGLARTFQNIRLFPAMTVLENVMIGRNCRTKATIFDALFKTQRAHREEHDAVAKSYALLEKVGLADLANEFSKNLSYGAQRRLEIARALATDPFLLLLDEPAAGMNPQETQELDSLIVRLRDEDKLAILLIEHDMKLVMNISDHIYVMEYGKEIAQGAPAAIKANPRVIEAYLGEEAPESEIACA